MSTRSRCRVRCTPRSRSKSPARVPPSCPASAATEQRAERHCGPGWLVHRQIRRNAGCRLQPAHLDRCQHCCVAGGRSGERSHIAVDLRQLRVPEFRFGRPRRECPYRRRGRLRLRAAARHSRAARGAALLQRSAPDGCPAGGPGQVRCLRSARPSTSRPAHSRPAVRGSGTALSTKLPPSTDWKPPSANSLSNTGISSAFEADDH